MSFLKNAKKFAKDASELNDSLKKMGISTRLGGQKDSSASTASESTAPSAYTPASSVAPSAPSETGPAETGPPVPVYSHEDALTGKLPMTVRKSVRDKWEANKAEREAAMIKVMGVPWTMWVDVPGVYSYACHDSYPKNNFGGCIDGYFYEGVRRIEEYVRETAEGRDEINRLAHRHIMTVEPSTDDAVRYCSAGTIDGRLVILFRPNQLAVNTDDGLRNIGDVVNKVGAEMDAAAGGSSGTVPLSMHARQSIQKYYTDKIDEHLEMARKCLQEPSFDFDPNFEANYTALKTYDDSIDPDDRFEKRTKLYHAWTQGLGGNTLGYFKGFVDQLRRDGFDKDEMLQEGFNEMVDKHLVRLVVQENIKKTYHEIDIEDGVLVIRTVPDQWAVNQSSTFEELVGLL